MCVHVSIFYASAKTFLINCLRCIRRRKYHASALNPFTKSYFRKNIKFYNFLPWRKLRTLNKLELFTLTAYGTTSTTSKQLSKEGIFDNIVLNWHIVTKWLQSDYIILMQICIETLWMWKVEEDFLITGSFFDKSF